VNNRYIKYSKIKYIRPGCSLDIDAELLFDVWETTLPIRIRSVERLSVNVDDVSRTVGGALVGWLFVRCCCGCCCRKLTPAGGIDESLGNVSYVSRKNDVIS